MSIYSILVATQYLAIAILFAELMYAICQKPSEMRAHVIVLTIASILMFVGYIIELDSSNPEEALAGAATGYLGKPFVMCASLLFLCSLYGKKVSKRLTVALYTYCLIFPAIVFTNDHHHLYYATVVFDADNKYSPLTMTRGPLYMLYVATSVLFFIACIAIIIRNYKKLKMKNRDNIAIVSMLMIISGIVGYAIYLTGLTNGYDSTILGIAVGVLCLFIIFIKYKVLDALTLAKEFALDDASVGLIVFDENDELVYANEFAQNLMKAGLGAEYIFNLDAGRSSFSSTGRSYSVLKKELSSDGVVFGSSVEISDVTFMHNYQTRLEHDVKERTERLESIQRAIIASVANLIEARSMETGEHIKRTGEFTAMIAAKLRQMGKYTDILTDKYVELLVAATPLHDVGKIGISDAILLKPGRLTPEEFSKMKEHVTIGAEVIDQTLGGLESPEYVKMARDIALYHHEWWDGTGYMNGRAGTDIPLSARIVAVADFFDAMTSERCYKPAYSVKESIAVMKKETGTHFDPVIVSAFIGALDDAGVRMY